jgi:hypothetical protein
MSSTAQRVQELKASFKEKTPKQMRTIRNNLNNRIKSFEDEMKYGKTLAVLTASHMFYGLELKELRELQEHALKRIKTDEKTKA